MLNRPQRIAAINDLSGFGRCSLTVIIPTLSAMGLQVCPVPTAVLSTHTGGLGECVFRDLTDFIQPTLEHYRSLQLDFECVYTGFLGSSDQIDLCRAFFAAYPSSFKVVDPVMGDHGKAYRTYTHEMVQRMKELAREGDLITPNLTEACLLLEQAYNEYPLSSSQAKSMLVRLSELGPDKVVVTSVLMADGTVCNVGYDRQRGAFWRVMCDFVPAEYPGTGDLFSSVLVGALLKGDSFPLAIDRATQFTELAVKTTFGYGTPPQHGVLIEPCLDWLTTHKILKSYTLL